MCISVVIAIKDVSSLLRSWKPHFVLRSLDPDESVDDFISVGFVRLTHKYSDEFLLLFLPQNPSPNGDGFFDSVEVIDNKNLIYCNKDARIVVLMVCIARTYYGDIVDTRYSKYNL